jgi:hypothetical protein
MNPENRSKLKARVVSAAAAALETQGYVSAIDVLTRIGWLSPSHLKEWRTGRRPSLEAVLQANLSRLSEAMRLFRKWAMEGGLRPSETRYLTRTPARAELRFSRSGDPAIERAYRTHWVSPELSAKKRQRLEQKMDRPPELVAIEPLNEDWKCHRCGGTGPFLIMEQPGPACLSCGGLGGLEFLPAGDGALSRLAKAKSPDHAVVVRFSRSRRRYERQGLLVQPDALREVKRELGRPASER